MKVDGVVCAVTSSVSESRFSQDIVITGGNNPLNKVHVNEVGAITTTFSSGNPQFDAFGKLQTSETTTIREYQPVTGLLTEDFSHTEELGATITWDDTRHLITMVNPTTNGALSRIRSNLYHKYQTGVATTVMFSKITGGEMTGITRRLGIFDDNDGLFFTSTNGVRSVVVRSSCSGEVVENKVDQEDWNVDRLDGSGDALNVSRKQLSPFNAQILFIDFQWLGAGRVRFGFVIDGVPIVCHEFNHAGYVTNPYMRTGTLPLTFEQENISALSNPAFLYMISAKVSCEGKFTPKEKLFGGSLPGLVTLNDSVNWQPLASFRSRQQYIGGIHDNRSVILPTMVTLSEFTTTNKPYLLELVKNDTLVGVTWDNGATFPQSALEVGGGSTASTDGEVIMSWTVRSDEHLDFSPYFNMLNEIIIRKADITEDPYHYTLRVKTYDATEIDVAVSFNWKEIR